MWSISRAFVRSMAYVKDRQTDPFGGRELPEVSINPNRLAGKVAMITGASSGVGLETAMLFSRSGADGVVLADWSPNGEEVANEINKERPGTAVFVQADVSNSGDMEKVISTGEDKFGKVNVLFNNAGVMLGDDDKAHNTSDETYQKTMDVNVKGVFYGCKYGIPALQRAGGGSVINVASFVAKLGSFGPQIAYTASKGAVLAMTRELAVIHARENIRCNSINPGPLRTELLMKILDTDEKLDFRLRHIPMGRFGEAREIAQAVAFLASDESSFMTANELTVDGGICGAYLVPDPN